jgi:hypothetical protein
LRVEASANGLVGCKLVGVGSSVPDSVLENKDLEKFVETNDEWITTRTGIRRRHVLGPNETMSDHAAQACIKALEMAGVEAGDIDLILMATSTPDDAFGSACQVGNPRALIRACITSNITAMGMPCWAVFDWLTSTTRLTGLLAQKPAPWGSDTFGMHDYGD